MDFSELLGSVPKDKFRQTANTLLNECFLLKNCADTKNSYYFLLRNKELFSSFFSLLGYEINIVEELGVISLTNLYGTSRIHLSRLESVILLILRLLYIEKKQKISQINDVITLVDEIYERYKMLKLKRVLNKTQMRSCLAKFRRYHLIQNLDPDMGYSETRIQIYPSITLAVTAVSLDELYKSSEQRLKTYTEGGDTDDNEENIDQA